MGQQEIVDCINENPNKIFSAKELSVKTKVSIGSATTSLEKIRRRKAVDFWDGYTITKQGHQRSCIKYKAKKKK